MKENIAMILVVIGFLILAVATIGSVGYGLYQWGSIGLPFNTSAWMAFVIWLKTVGSGFLLVILGLLLKGIR